MWLLLQVMIVEDVRVIVCDFTRVLYSGRELLRSTLSLSLELLLCIRSNVLGMGIWTIVGFP